MTLQCLCVLHNHPISHSPFDGALDYNFVFWKIRHIKYEPLDEFSSMMDKNRIYGVLLSNLALELRTNSQMGLIVKEVMDEKVICQIYKVLNVILVKLVAVYKVLDTCPVL